MRGGGWRSQSGRFRHEALLYAGRGQFVDRVAEFVVEGLVRGEPAVVAVSGAKIEALRSVLGDDKGVLYTDMDVVGRNPARLIPAYHDFIRTRAPNGRSRGVGEPVGPHRRGAELVECEIHESLCNLAFAATAWWVVCPYDTATLDPVVIDGARRNHPFVVEGGAPRASPTYRAPAALDGPLGDPLPDPPGAVRRLVLAPERRFEIRRFVSQDATGAGLDAERAHASARAVDKVVAGSLRRAPRGGVLSLWREGSRLLAEVRDPGRITDPLAGREPSGTGAEVRAGAGDGLRMANQLCDLLQVRSDPSGTTVRIHVSVAE